MQERGTILPCQLQDYKTPNSILVQHWERLKSRKKEQQKRNSKAAEKGGLTFCGEEETEFTG